jgi:hypothetical protein
LVLAEQALFLQLRLKVAVGVHQYLMRHHPVLLLGESLPRAAVAGGQTLTLAEQQEVLGEVEITVLGLLVLEFQAKGMLAAMAWRRLQIITAVAVAAVLELLVCQKHKLRGLVLGGPG